MLDSIKDIVDGIVVIDTGSTDDSINALNRKKSISNVNED